MVQTWKTTLKDGRSIKLRFLTKKDDERLFQMFSTMSKKALEWSMAPYTKEGIKRWINNIPNAIALVAEYQDNIVGLASIFKFPNPRRKGLGDLAIYLHQDFHNMGLGTAMTQRLLQLAKDEKLHRIELTVVKENTIATHLYQKTGFQIEGISKDAFYGQDCKYYDIINMGLVLR
jgi:RimJ/RimL family protein N-acetyltransferase